MFRAIPGTVVYSADRFKDGELNQLLVKSVWITQLKHPLILFDPFDLGMKD